MAFLKYIHPTFSDVDSILILAPSLTIKEVEVVPFIPINLLGLIVNPPVPDNVKVAPFSKYIVPSCSLFGESINVDSPVRTKLTCFPQLINKGVKLLLFINVKPLKFKVHEDSTNISLSSSSPEKSYSPSPVIVKILSSIVYPSPSESNETIVDDMMVISNKKSIKKMMFFGFILFLFLYN